MKRRHSLHSTSFGPMLSLGHYSPEARHTLARTRARIQSRGSAHQDPRQESHPRRQVLWVCGCVRKMHWEPWYKLCWARKHSCRQAISHMGTRLHKYRSTTQRVNNANADKGPPTFHTCQWLLGIGKSSRGLQEAKCVGWSSDEIEGAGGRAPFREELILMKSNLRSLCFTNLGGKDSPSEHIPSSWELKSAILTAPETESIISNSDRSFTSATIGPCDDQTLSNSMWSKKERWGENITVEGSS